MSEIVTPDHTVETWKRELHAAGWHETKVNVWACPEGLLYRGPYGAWCEMHRRLANAKPTVNADGN